MASHPKDDGYLKVILPKRVALFESIQAKQLSQLRAVAGDPIKITLPDGSVKDGRKWETSPFDVAKELSESLAANALIAQVNGGLWDMTRPLERDCNLKIFTFDSDEGRDTFWHSSGHILGQSLEMEYGCKLCIGPCTTRGEGFYYDAFYGDLGVNEGHFKQIEAAASRVIAEKQPFERIEVSRDQALDIFSENPFKVEIINDLPGDETITVYRCGPLVDLCQGPHIPNTSFVKSFAILKATSVYWRGNEDRESLLRVCGISYTDQNKLEMTSISTSASSSQTINPPDSILSSSSSATFFLPPPPPLSSSTPIFPLQPQPQLQLQPQFTSLTFQNPNPSVPPPPPPPLPLPLLLPPQQQQQQLRPHSFLPVVTVPNAFLLPPPGVAAYPSAYSATIRPVFPPRPLGGMGVFPAIPRPLAPVATGIRPIFPPVVRPALVPAAPAEKPQTTVYVGKIAPTVENDFMLSLLQLCGPVKNWTRPQDPSNGAPKGFGFCEFESAEGVLRALRLLSKLSIDGQELMLNVNQATRGYLERYVEKKTENAKKLIGTEPAVQKEGEDSQAAPVTESNAEKNNLSNAIEGNLNNESESEKESNSNANFGVVTDLDKEADKEALQKLMLMIEERLKNKPLPPPASPAPLADVLGNGSETPAKSRDKVSGTDIDDGIQKNEEDAACDNRTSDLDRTDIRSPERNRRYDRRQKEHDRERDQHREKEKELERYEREAEREKVRKERDQRRRLEEAEREYEQRHKDWEYREREREKQRQYEKEREKERERKRRKEIIYDEENDDDDTRKRWHRSVLEERRRRRIREKEDDLADRKKEEEEIAVAKMRAEEEEQQQLQRQREALKLFSGNVRSSHDISSPLEKTTLTHLHLEDDTAHEINTADGNGWQVGPPDTSTLSAVAIADIHHNSNVPAKKLGFGLVGSGKRTAVPSFFTEEDDDDTHKEKKLRPLVPIDYSTEEIQAVQPSFAGHSQPNLAAAAEFAKRISNASVKEDKPEYDREKSRRSHDRSSQRDKGRNDEDANRTKDDSRVKNHDRDREREQGLEMSKTADNKKLWDAKQLIDMIPRTKEDLFSYEINWALYDQYGLHERMRPWISKKIMEFLGEEETSLVDFIVSSTQEHVKAAEMLETLKSILDEEAEMFVLKMWRMLIFEIKKIETGLHLRSRS